MHANWSDVLVCIDGEADVITGGTLIDRKVQADGESRGSRGEGGTHHMNKLRISYFSQLQHRRQAAL